MENSFNNRGDFEQYVKTNADQYRMIPSEKVWKGINNILHTRRKWYGLGLTLLLLVTGVSVTWVMMSYPVSKKQQVVNADISSSEPQNSLSNNTEETPAPVSDIKNILSINKFSKQDIAAQSSSDQSVATTSNNIAEDAGNISLAIDNKTDEHFQVQVINPERSSRTASAEKSERNSSIINDLTDKIKADLPMITGGKKATTDNTDDQPKKAVTKNNHSNNPLTIESVLNSSHAKKINKGLIWQVYFAPTVSYRKLSQNKSFQNSPPFSPASYPFTSLTDVNREVTHKPDMGLELGVSTKYPLTKNLRLTGGLQFNVNRYDIKAFIYNGEQATIDLDGGNNSVSAWTYYRNYDGYKSDWLKNFYFTISAPIGAELTLFGNNKTSFGIAGTVQPTYILSDRAYLISTDFKNYAEVPWLIRHVNVNTSFESFISYTNSRGTRWQVGPQVRYQVLSSFQNKYPVKENLFDFGLKVGVTLNQ